MKQENWGNGKMYEKAKCYYTTSKISLLYVSFQSVNLNTSEEALFDSKKL